MSNKHKGRKSCRHPKQKPYGARGTDNYCRPHDMCKVYDVSNTAVRMRAKRAIKKELKEQD